MNRILQGQPMPIFGDGLQTRAFSHIDDVAPIIASAPLVDGSRNEVFNVGADRPYTILELAQTIAAAFGVEPELVHLPARHEVVHAFSTHEKVRSVFGESASVELKDGIERMAEWVKAVGVRPEVAFPGTIEVPINMPPSWAAMTQRD
jgi:UDP-glucose 4-epimerase